MSFVPIELSGFQQWVGCILGIFLGLMVQGEGQAFFVLLFQPLKDRGKATYDLNPMHHIDPRAFPVLLLTGWGWGSKRVEEPPYFPPGWIYSSLVPLSAPLANFCLVGVLSSVYIFFPNTVLDLAIKVNVLMAVANLTIPIPPMALGRALCRPFKILVEYQSHVELVGAVVLTLLVALDYWAKTPFLQKWIVSVSWTISKWVVSF